MGVSDIFHRLEASGTFHPGTVELFDDFLLEAGDIVQVLSDGNSFDLPIFNQHIEWFGSAMTTLTSTGNKERSDLPPLQKKQKNRSYRSGQRQTEQEEQLYGLHTQVIDQHDLIGLSAEAIGVLMDENGNPVLDENGQYIWDTTTAAKIYSNLLLSHNRAQLVSAINNGAGDQISGAKIDLSAQGSVLIQAINNRPSGESSVTIDADKINLTGYVTATALDTRMANVDQLFTTAGYAGTIYAGSASITGQIAANTVIGSPYVQAAQLWLLDGEGNRSVRITGTGVSGFGTVTSSTTGEISIPYYTFQVPVGSANPAGTINFNIANMAYYQNHVGISTVSPAKAWSWDADDGYSMLVTATAKDGTTKSCGVQPPTITLSTNLGTSATTAVHCYGPEVSGNQHALAMQYSLYLKADNNYCYITKDNNTATVGTNVLARITNPKPDASGTITDIVHATPTWDGDNAVLSVRTTAKGSGVSDYTKTLTFSTGISAGGWTNNSTRNTVTATVAGVSIGSTVVSAPSVTGGFDRVNSLPSGQTANTLTSGNLYHFYYKRGSTTVASRYYKCP